MSETSKFGRRYDREFKEKAIALVLGGRSQGEVSRDLGVSAWSLGEWVKKARAGHVPTQAATLGAESEEQRELRRLRQEVGYLREQRESSGARQTAAGSPKGARGGAHQILKKALGICSVQMPGSASR